MNFDNFDQAEFLEKAQPYVSKYKGKTVVVKYGGNAMTSPELKAQVISDLALLSSLGIKMVLVHGGGPDINALLAKVGKESTWVNGLRVTDSETVEYAQMALSGKVSKELVNLIECQGTKAMSLSGVDGHMIKAEMKNPGLGYVGSITEIDPAPVNMLLDNGYIPVISTIGCDDEGNVYNINADTAAAKVAGALKADTFIAMTDIAGVLMDKDDPSTLVSHLTLAETEKLIADGIIAGGMIPKVECCTGAVADGVSKVFIIDGRVPHSILLQMLTDENIGTMFEA